MDLGSDWLIIDVYKWLVSTTVSTRHGKKYIAYGVKYHMQGLNDGN